jgi:hypothetical protein
LRHRFPRRGRDSGVNRPMVDARRASHLESTAVPPGLGPRVCRRSVGVSPSALELAPHQRFGIQRPQTLPAQPALLPHHSGERDAQHLRNPQGTPATLPQPLDLRARTAARARRARRTAQAIRGHGYPPRPVAPHQRRALVVLSPTPNATRVTGSRAASRRTIPSRPVRREACRLLVVHRALWRSPVEYPR